MLRDGLASVVGCDEVGRGALSGPVTVGMVLVTSSSAPAPLGVKDSKLLTASSREALVPRIHAWADAWGIGHAAPTEIDSLGIMGAMRLAATRAYQQLGADAGMILLDGNHDYLSAPAQASLWEEPSQSPDLPPVTTLIKADMSCASVAAASVLAKTARDQLMRELAGRHPQYGWDVNKGYASSAHMEALRTHGPCEHHRRSWKLPEVTG
jgi:ribonuclease HII